MGIVRRLNRCQRTLDRGGSPPQEVRFRNDRARIERAVSRLVRRRGPVRAEGRRRTGRRVMIDHTATFADWRHRGCGFDRDDRVGRPAAGTLEARRRRPRAAAVVASAVHDALTATIDPRHGVVHAVSTRHHAREGRRGTAEGHRPRPGANPAASTDGDGTPAGTLPMTSAEASTASARARPAGRNPLPPRRAPHATPTR